MNVPTPTEHNVTATPQAGKPERKRIMATEARRIAFHPHAVTATVAAVMRPPLTESVRFTCP
jgi:hypothetical protein